MLNTGRKPLTGAAIATALLLHVPALAMHFTTEVDWDAADFAAAAILLFAAGATAVAGFGRITALRQRVALVLALIFGLTVVWAELAVGVVG